MLIKRITFLFLLIATAAIFQECCKPVPRFFRRTNMHITHAAQNSLPASNEHLPINDTIVTDTLQRYVLYANFDLDYLAFKNNAISISDLFFISAYASKPCPDPGEKGTKEKITSITITSEADFDDSYPAGKSLNKFFRVLGNSNSFTDSLNVNQINGQWPDFQLDLIKKPSKDSVHKFTVHLELSNGINLSAKSPVAIFRIK